MLNSLLCVFTSRAGGLSPQRDIQRPLSPLSVFVSVPVSAVVAVMVVVVDPVLAGFFQGVVPQVDLLGPLWGHSGGGALHRAGIRDRLRDGQTFIKCH